MPDGMLHLAFIGPGTSEFVVIMLVLVVLFGSKDAPRILRKLNGILSNIRNTADHFKHEVLYGDLAEGMDDQASEDVDLAVFEEEGADNVSESHDNVMEPECSPESEMSGDDDEKRV